ncbi:uncharacterized protein LOC117543450 isoform X1 [Gymnodraco acuticeps]|uniref:Uncharacterized protein LOC117543450 isoform X1 n=1 Tax=Gymnodraco acuticeps TaxID=8218 RepID=A0A6P8TTJ3_GYMAC|nr:uncharacterized protein LOC117543450 isoform X1 [Gymnodraco acuticeps]
MEEKRQQMEMEMPKKDPDHQFIEALMTDTFSQLRREIVGDQPLITELKSRWPALFSERQIQAEFKRIVTMDLLSSFLDGLDGLAPTLLEVYKGASRTGKKPALKGILDCLEKDNTNERRRTAALLGLSHYLSGENQANVIRMCDAHGDTLEEAMKGMQVGLLIGYEGERDAFPQQIFNVAVVVEETIVFHNLKDVACGFVMLLGLIYCLNLQYPLEMKFSFEFLQRVVLKIQPDQASAKIQGLKNKLARR